MMKPMYSRLARTTAKNIDFKNRVGSLKMYVQYVSNYDQKVQATLEALKVRAKASCVS